MGACDFGVQNSIVIFSLCFFCWVFCKDIVCEMGEHEIMFCFFYLFSFYQRIDHCTWTSPTGLNLGKTRLFIPI